MAASISRHRLNTVAKSQVCDTVMMVSLSGRE